jgi:hypothetical protein
VAKKRKSKSINKGNNREKAKMAKSGGNRRRSARENESEETKRKRRKISKAKKTSAKPSSLKMKMSIGAMAAANIGENQAMTGVSVGGEKASASAAQRQWRQPSAKNGWRRQWRHRQLKKVKESSGVWRRRNGEINGVIESNGGMALSKYISRGAASA